jgi:hypothetical protein
VSRRGAVRPPVSVKQTIASLTLSCALLSPLVTDCTPVTVTPIAMSEGSIVIRGVLTVSRADCTFQLATTSALDLEGQIDAAYASEFLATLLVENDFVPPGDANTATTEADSVQLDEAEVQILDPANGNSVITSYSVPVTGFIDPSMSGTPGLGAVDVVLLDAATLQKEEALVVATGEPQQVVSSVVVQGQTLDNLDVHTQDFLFPITITVGSTCVAGMSGPCVGGTGPSPMNDCRLGIDESTGTSCQAIAAQEGVCGKLECTTVGVAATAQCPTHVPPDQSCCQ